MVLFLITLPVVCSGEDFYEARLNSGIRNTEAFSYLLIEKARENSPEAIELLKEAVKASPDLPAVYFELAKARFSWSYSGMLESVSYIIEGMIAYTRNFWWSFTLAESLFFSVVVSFLAAITILIGVRYRGDVQLFSHDFAETKYFLSLLILLAVVSVISPLLFLAGMMILLGIYMKRLDRAIVYLFLVFLVLSPLFFRATSLFMHVQSSPRMKAVVAVNEAKDNKYALAVLDNSDDYASLFSYALALKREGSYDKAAAVYQRLLEKRPDPKVYVNLGNCSVGMKNMEEAITYYLKAEAMKPLASAYYNLSQVSREIFDFAKGSEYFSRALELDRDAVARYSAIYSRNPNRIVVDETLSFADLWHVALGDPGRVVTFGVTLLPPFFVSGIAVALIILYFLLSSRLKNRAFRCKRCNVILCPRCEKRPLWGKMCSVCYASLIKLDELEVKGRVAKLLSVYNHQKKRRSIMKVFSFLVPGASHIYAGRILQGLFVLWLFLFFLTLPVLYIIFSGDGALYAHLFFIWGAILGAVLIYIISNIITRQRIAKGWL